MALDRPWWRSTCRTTGTPTAEATAPSDHRRAARHVAVAIEALAARQRSSACRWSHHRPGRSPSGPRPGDRPRRRDPGRGRAQGPRHHRVHRRTAELRQLRRDLLARTIEFNPTRTESSLRQGILHNAMQLEDGSWVWRYARFRPARTPRDPPPPRVRLALGHRVHHRGPAHARPRDAEQSVVDDADETELRRRCPAADRARGRCRPQRAGRHAGRAGSADRLVRAAP